MFGIFLFLEQLYEATNRWLNVAFVNVTNTFTQNDVLTVDRLQFATVHIIKIELHKKHINAITVPHASRSSPVQFNFEFLIH